MLHRGRASVWDDAEVLETHGGDGCPALRRYFTPLNCTLKNNSNGKLQVYFTIENKDRKMTQKAIVEAGGQLTLQLHKLIGGKGKIVEELSHMKKFRWCGVILTTGQPL